MPNMFRITIPGLALITALSAVAQTSTGSSLEQFRARLLRESHVSVAVPGLHAATKVLVRPVDNRVVNGVVQNRAVMGMLRGSDDRLLQPGEPVRIIAVDSSSDAKDDILRLTVATSTGARAPIAFVLPSGSVASLSEPQLEQIVLPILILTASVSHATPSASAAGFDTPRAPIGWVVRPSSIGQEAFITGTAEAGGKRIPAALVLSCTTKESKEDGWFSPLPAGSPLFQLRLRRSDLTYDISSLYEKDGDDNAFMHLQIGSTPEITTALSLYSSAPEKANAASLVPDLQVAEFKQVLQATSTSLRVALSSPDIPPTSSITAHFELPADSAPAQAAMSSCLQQAQAGATALTASRPVACPSRPGLVLVQGTVEYAASKKPFPVEPDRDQGVGWLLPKPTRARPTPPKLILSCGYAPLTPVAISANVPRSPRKPTETLDLAIPASAAGSECETISLLHERLGNVRTFAERVQFLHRYFLRRFQGGEPVDPLYKAIHRLTVSVGTLRVEEVARQIGVNRRYLERKALIYAGVSPKALTRIARFSRALQFRTNTSQNWTQIAHAAGYHDHMHMIRDFRVFAGDAPTSALQEIAPDHLIHFAH